MTPILSRPALRGSRLLFVSDDDLWTVGADGGTASRLTSGESVPAAPILSHDGRTVAYLSSEDGASDLYLMDVEGGPAVRRTWLGVGPRPLTFTPDDQHVVVTHGAGLPMPKEPHLARVPVASGLPEPLGWGPGQGFAYGPSGQRVICRNQLDLAHWKRYRGGRVGQLWVDADGSGAFVALPSLGGNLACPLWVEADDEARIVFVSDHDGVANLYSVRPNGNDLIQHTHHTDRAVRFPCHDAGRVVYEHAGHLYALQLASGESERLPIVLRSQHARAHTRHVAAARHLEGVALHPGGHSVALTVRGRPFVGGHWEGPMLQLGPREGVRHRLVRFLGDGEHALWVSDAGGEEHLELCALDALTVLPLDLDGSHGRILALSPGPGTRIAIVDDDNRVGIVTLDDGDSDGLLRSARLTWLTDAAEREPPHGLSWSPDGRWLVFAEPIYRQRARIRLVDLGALPEGRITDVTDGTYADASPSFDPAGRW
ncbi:MAG: PD40 domain-containing protein, partial [Myxococcales bacterium]|nr:PD40 domain-containing protein [Myxococcales bacterium]